MFFQNRRFYRNTLAAAAGMTLMLGAITGCESHPRATGAGVGAGAGAGVGALVGEAAADSPGAGAAIGAGIGGLGGYVAADEIEEREGGHTDYPENYHRHGDFGHSHPHSGPHTHETAQ